MFEVTKHIGLCGYDNKTHENSKNYICAFMFLCGRRGIGMSF